MTKTYDRLLEIIKKQSEVIIELVNKSAEQENLISVLLSERNGA